MDQGTEMSFK